MKLSKTAQLALGIGILAIALLSLLVVYRQQRGEIGRLDDALPVAQSTLPKTVSEKEGVQSQLTAVESQLALLESKLTQATTLLNTSKVSFPNTVESIEFGEALFKFASSWNLEITRLTSSEARDREEEELAFSVTTIAVDVQGEVDDILNFVDAIATGEDFTPATVELATVSVPEPLTEEELEGLTEDEIAEETAPTATVELTIYGYRGE
jgi:hypothetical protein